MGNSSGCQVARVQGCDVEKGCDVERARPHHIIEAPVPNMEVNEKLTPEVVVHMIICAMDYKLTADPLTSTTDGKNMAHLARACGVQWLTVLTDEAEPLTKAQVREAILAHGRSCREDDMFLFYFAGHGVQLKHAHGSSSGDVVSSRDDAYCFQNTQGRVNRNSCMTDEEFASILSACVPAFTRMIILSDCCHSDTIANLDEAMWADREVVSLSSCLDSQEAADTGNGGVFTNALLLAVEVLKESGRKEYSVQELYNVAFSQKLLHYGRATQRFSIEHTGGVRVQGMSWPLIPEGLSSSLPVELEAEFKARGAYRKPFH